MLRLTITNTEDQQVREVTIDHDLLAGDGVIVGRASGVGVLLDHRHVSRAHARFTLVDGQVLITDLDSTSGSVLNDQKMASGLAQAVTSDSTIRIGPFEMNCVIAGTAPVVDEEVTMLGAAGPETYQPVALVNDDQWQYWNGGQIDVTCSHIIEETHDVKTFVWTAEPHRLYRYLPGQFFTLHLEIDGQPVTRSYTISSTPSRPHTITCTVKRVPAAGEHPPGVVSNWLHDHMEVGKRIQISGPYGDFTAHKHPSNKLALISGGSGITPMLSMARWHTDTASSVDIVFVHLAKSAEDLICRRELDMLAANNPNLRLVYALSRPQSVDAWTGHIGRLNIPMLRSAIADLNERTVFTCGPAPFMSSVKDMLAGDGFPMAQYHEESFGGPAAAPKPKKAPEPAPAEKSEVTPRFGLKSLLKSFGKGMPKDEDITPEPNTKQAIDLSGPIVTLKQSGDSFPAADDAILPCAEAAGHSLPCACRAGMCGACKQILVKGEIHRDDYNDGILSDADREAGYILTCIAKAKGPVELDA